MSSPAGLGAFHPSGCCYRCGASRTRLVLTVVKETNARAWRCFDITACIRRETKRKNERAEKLFMRTGRGVQNAR